MPIEPATPPQLPPRAPKSYNELQCLSLVLIVMSGYLFVSRPTHDTATIAFRLCILLAGTIGFVVITAKQRARSYRAAHHPRDEHRR